MRDIGLGGAKAKQIAADAQRERLCFLTGDFDFSDIRNYPPENYSGLVIRTIPPNATASVILSLLESFLKQDELVS